MIEVHQLSQAMNANFHDHVRQYKPKVSDLLLMSMALSSNPSCHSTVIYPFFSLKSYYRMKEKLVREYIIHHMVIIRGTKEWCFWLPVVEILTSEACMSDER